MRKSAVSCFKMSCMALFTALAVLLSACQAGPEPQSLPTTRPIPLLPPTFTPQNTPLPPVSTSTNPSTAAPTDKPLPTPYAAAPRNIILIVVDSLRADHLGAYGYDRPTSPNLDRLVAGQGAKFDLALPSAPWTCPANASMLTSLMPSNLNFSYATLTNTLPEKYFTLAEYLQAAGFLTAGFSTNPCILNRYGFGQGFDYFDDSQAARKGSADRDKVSAGELNARVKEWLSNNYLNAPDTRPGLFLYLYYMDTHVWFDPPPPYNTFFDDNYNGLNNEELYKFDETVYGGVHPYTERDIFHKIAQYDSEIAYWDAQFAELDAFLAQNGLVNDTLLIITADHGESLGEYGMWNHANGLDQEVLLTPLLMRFPSAIPAGLEIAAPVSTIDIMPTILTWAGIPVLPGLQGQNLRAIAQGLGGGDPNRPLFSEIDGISDPKHWAYWLAPHETLYSVYQAGWRYILHSGNPSADELYLLNQTSPFQGENLLAEKPGRAADLRQLIVDYFNLK